MAERLLKSTSLEFEAKSTDPDRQTVEAVREVIRLSSELQAIVSEKYPGIAIKIQRAEGLPVSALVQHLLVSVDWHAVASGAEKAIGAFVTTEFLSLVKSRVRNLFAKPTAEKGPSTKKRAAIKQPKQKRIAGEAKRGGRRSTE